MTPRSAITIRLDWPYDELSPNSRAHWRRKAQSKHVYRTACKVLALAARDTRTEYPLRAPVEGHLEFRTTALRGYDADNLIAWMKSGIDGVADAGVIANDRDIVSWSVEVRKHVSREVIVTLREKQP